MIVGNLGAQKEKRNDTPISAKKDKFQDYDFAFFVSDITWKSAFLEPIDENFQLTSPYQDEI